MKPTSRRFILGLTLILSVAGINPLFAQPDYWQRTKTVPPSKLPSLTNDPSPAQVVERLKQYVTTGEDLAIKFDANLKEYKGLAERYIEVRAGCISEQAYGTKLFRDSDQISICNQGNQRELKTDLRKQAEMLDGHETELVTIKKKIAQASRRVSEVLQMQELESLVKKMDQSIKDAGKIKEDLDKVENQ